MGSSNKKAICSPNSSSKPPALISRREIETTGEMKEVLKTNFLHVFKRSQELKAAKSAFQEKLYAVSFAVSNWEKLKMVIFDLKTKKNYLEQKIEFFKKERKKSALEAKRSLAQISRLARVKSAHEALIVTHNEALAEIAVLKE